MPRESSLHRRSLHITLLSPEGLRTLALASKIPVDLVEGLTLKVLDEVFGNLPWPYLSSDL